jgi:hypothetical protein
LNTVIIVVSVAAPVRNSTFAMPSLTGEENQAPSTRTDPQKSDTSESDMGFDVPTVSPQPLVVLFPEGKAAFRALI